ncbi:hypothetical protein AURDEDRAFT_178458 [Auricularia subglabra TFB-10046 SS5]|uniref:Uncharacterized protein n=1 Tax=Auricularia subglabra (strain TFB-10046 / SS5) TaxID=717982 RepID=J0D1L4_AURST|nr:hypothetical protein AURDEDRAFT_178458 [Auricularia subglabra TFB-10046 SS5]
MGHAGLRARASRGSFAGPSVVPRRVSASEQGSSHESLRCTPFSPTPTRWSSAVPQSQQTFRGALQPRAASPRPARGLPPAEPPRIAFAAASVGVDPSATPVQACTLDAEPAKRSKEDGNGILARAGTAPAVSQERFLIAVDYPTQARPAANVEPGVTSEALLRRPAAPDSSHRARGEADFLPPAARFKSSSPRIDNLSRVSSACRASTTRPSAPPDCVSGPFFGPAARHEVISDCHAKASIAPSSVITSSDFRACGAEDTLDVATGSRCCISPPSMPTCSAVHTGAFSGA